MSASGTPTLNGKATEGKKVADAGGDYGDETDMLPGNFEKQIIDRNLVHGKNKSSRGLQDGPKIGAGKLATDEESDSNQTNSNANVESPGFNQSVKIVSDENNKMDSHQHHEVQVASFCFRNLMLRVG
jgi:hypothetical protein